MGFYHPDVANTYHVFGWFLYEPRRPAFALVYFLRAFRICRRIFGDDHTSTKLLLDDIRFMVHEHDADASSVMEDCYAIFDSWICQNHAENALFLNNDPLAAVAWYQTALRILPTRTIPTVPFPYDGMLYSIRYSEPLCLAELERAIVHLHIAVVLQAVLTDSTENTQQTCWSNNSNQNYTLTEAADLYCRALSVLPQWFDEDHPTLIQIRKDAPRIILDAALIEKDRWLKTRWIRWTSWHWCPGLMKDIINFMTLSQKDHTRTPKRDFAILKYKTF